MMSSALMDDPHRRPASGVTAGGGTRTTAKPPVAVLRRWRPTRSRLLSLLLNALITGAVVFVVLLISPGITTSGDVSVLVTIVVLAVVATLVRPLLVVIAALVPPGIALLLGLLAHAVVVYIAISIAPGVSVSSFWWALFAAWLTAILTTLLAWVGDEDEAD